LNADPSAVNIITAVELNGAGGDQRVGGVVDEYPPAGFEDVVVDDAVDGDDGDDDDGCCEDAEVDGIESPCCFMAKFPSRAFKSCNAYRAASKPPP
jgi:hypothetical protein